jgi:hypothetical protein
VGLSNDEQVEPESLDFRRGGNKSIHQTQIEQLQSSDGWLLLTYASIGYEFAILISDKTYMLNIIDVDI